MTRGLVLATTDLPFKGPYLERLRTIAAPDKLVTIDPADAEGIAAALQHAEIALLGDDLDDRYLAAPKLKWVHVNLAGMTKSARPAVFDRGLDLQERHRFSCLFIAHDLAVVRHIADRVAVMYLGRIVEIGPKRSIYAAPQHPYTQALLSAAPNLDPDQQSKRIILEGDVPSPTRVPPGCSFHTRCPLAQPICSVERPPLHEVAPAQFAACHFARPNPIDMTAKTN